MGRAAGPAGRLLAPVRQGRTPAWPQDGTRHLRRANPGRGPRALAGRLHDPGYWPVSAVNEQHIDQATIGAAARALEQGALVAFPTETVYGLGADAENPVAVASIYAAKGRPQDHPV